jgi:hypothetical protein
MLGAMNRAKEYELVFGDLLGATAVLSPRERRWAARVLIWSFVARRVAGCALCLVSLAVVTGHAIATVV